MPDAKKVREEITNAIKKKRGDKVPDSLWKLIETELDFCEATDGLEGKNNLQAFYSIWKKREGQVGHKNLINSWTYYSLGLTDAKPDGEFMLKRRAFARAGFPDIDMDFEDSRQNDVFEYLVDTYGRDKGGRIGTHQFLAFKSCITRATKALDIANAFHKGPDVMTTENARKVSEILSPFPKGGIIRLRGDDGEMHIIKNIKDALEFCPDFKHYMDKYPLLKKHSTMLEKNFSAFGCLSADTPILTDKGWVRIDQLSAKFKVAYINKDGEVEFTNKFDSFKTGYKKTYKLKLKDGGSVSITDEHLVFTDKGCVKFEEIRKNQEKYKIYGFKKGVLD